MESSPPVISTTVLKRRGDVTKCPVCGSSVDPDAFCCPTCRSFFCYHCRARVLPSDTQLQCVNQSCDYYGRLVCGICDPKHVREEEPTVYLEPEDGFWPLLAILSLIGGCYAWFRWGLHWGWALMVMAGIFGLLSLVVMAVKKPVFGRHNRVEQRRQSTYHTCIACGETTRKLARTS